MSSRQEEREFLLQRYVRFRCKRYYELSLIIKFRGAYVTPKCERDLVRLRPHHYVVPLCRVNFRLNSDKRSEEFKVINAFDKGAVCIATDNV